MRPLFPLLTLPVLLAPASALLAAALEPELTIARAACRSGWTSHHLP
ncbi:MAG: hypothetical protein P3W87_008850 [Gammaproteobacteria bacterium]|nr:hypothetical protein [Gammaproteobacteria bacterium]